MKTRELSCGERVPITPIGNWTDEPCYYVSVVDGPKFGVLAGPFRTHQEALDMVDNAREAANDADPWAAFYAFGTVKMSSGHHCGILNGKLGL